MTKKKVIIFVSVAIVVLILLKEFMLAIVVASIIAIISVIWQMIKNLRSPIKGNLGQGIFSTLFNRLMLLGPDVKIISADNFRISIAGETIYGYFYFYIMYDTEEVAITWSSDEGHFKRKELSWIFDFEKITKQEEMFETIIEGILYNLKPKKKTINFSNSLIISKDNIDSFVQNLAQIIDIEIKERLAEAKNFDPSLKINRAIKIMVTNSMREFVDDIVAKNRKELDLTDEQVESIASNVLEHVANKHNLYELFDN